MYYGSNNLLEFSINANMSENDLLAKMVEAYGEVNKQTMLKKLREDTPLEEIEQELRDELNAHPKTGSNLVLMDIEPRLEDTRKRERLLLKCMGNTIYWDRWDHLARATLRIILESHQLIFLTREVNSDSIRAAKLCALYWRQQIEGAQKSSTVCLSHAA